MFAIINNWYKTLNYKTLTIKRSKNNLKGKWVKKTFDGNRKLNQIVIKNTSLCKLMYRLNIHSRFLRSCYLHTVTNQLNINIILWIYYKWQVWVCNILHNFIHWTIIFLSLKKCIEIAYTNLYYLYFISIP